MPRCFKAVYTDLLVLQQLHCYFLFPKYFPLQPKAKFFNLTTFKSS